MRAVGGFFAVALDTFRLMFVPPFAWRELLLQGWFVARVSLLPTVMLAIPFTVLNVFTLNLLLLEFGAADFSGTTAALAAVTQIGPLVTVLVVARVLAATFVAFLLSSVVTLVGLFGAFLFSVYGQHVTPGAFLAGLTLLTGPSEVVIALTKAALFGLAASLIA